MGYVQMMYETELRDNELSKIFGRKFELELNIAS